MSELWILVPLSLLCLHYLILEIKLDRLYRRNLKRLKDEHEALNNEKQ